MTPKMISRLKMLDMRDDNAKGEKADGEASNRDEENGGVELL